MSDAALAKAGCTIDQARCVCAAPKFESELCSIPSESGTKKALAFTEAAVPLQHTAPCSVRRRSLQLFNLQAPDRVDHHEGRVCVSLSVYNTQRKNGAGYVLKGQ